MNKIMASDKFMFSVMSQAVITYSRSKLYSEV
jgi:hypothetical protein